jgi:tetratricopeptide (TPR) repeat protein
MRIIERAPTAGGVSTRPVVGGHRLLCEIGRGGMGVVFEAERISDGQRVAVKLLSTPGVAEPEDIERFQREARAVARLRHPNIVPVVGFGEDEGVLFLVLELLSGGNVEAWIDRERDAWRPDRSRLASIRDAARIAASIADALAHAHKEGLVHRDVTPANIFVRDDGVPLLMDFGLARDLGGRALTRSDEFLGTPRYVSPEQVQGRPVDGRTDVYALGATLYEMIVLEPPFPGREPAEVLHRVLRSPPARPRRVDPLIPRALETIVLRCLEKEPDWRYPDAPSLAEDLRRFLRGEPISARPVRWPVRLVRRVRRRPAVTAATLALLLLPGVAGWGLWSHENDQRLLRAVAAREQEKEFTALLEECDDLAVRDRFDRALDLTDRILRRDPGHLEARLRAAFLRVERGSAPDRTLQEIESLLRDVPDLSLLHRLQGRVLRRLGKGDEARAAEARAAARPPRLATELYYSSLERKAAGDPEEALRLISRALELEPQNARYFHHRLHLHESQRHWLGALEDARVYVRLAWNRPSSHFHLGRALAATGRHAEAIEAYQRALQLAPSNAYAWKNLAQSQLKVSRPAEALESVRKAARHEKDAPRLFVDLATLAGEAGDIPEGLALAARALELERDFVPALIAQGDLLRRSNDLPGAEAMLLRAVDAMPENEDAHFRLGLVLHERKELERAERAYRKAVTLRPRFASAWNNLGLVLMDRKVLEDARAAFQRVLELDDGHMKARYNLGLAHEKLGETETALACFREAVRRSPEYLSAWLALARVAERAGDARSAAEAHQKALVADPRSDRAHGGLISFRRRTGDLAGAVAALDDVPSELVGSPTIERLRAEVRGDYRQWRQLLQAVEQSLAGRDHERAERLARRAVALTRRRDAESLLALARAQQGAGDRDEAQRTAREALQLAGARHDVAAALAAIAGPVPGSK